MFGKWAIFTSKLSLDRNLKGFLDGLTLWASLTEHTATENGKKENHRLNPTKLFDNHILLYLILFYKKIMTINAI